MLTVAEYLDHPDWAVMIKANREQHCHLEGKYELYDSNPTVKLHVCWSRVPLILEKLKGGYDRVVWVDADAVLYGSVTEDDLPDRLAFAHDAGGINDGVTVTVKRDIPMWEAVYGLRYEMTNYNGLHVNGILRAINPIHDVLALDMWNARWPTHYMKIRHFAGEMGRYESVKRACGGERV